MNEKVKRQQLSLMLYNLIAFSIIFTLFGIILYSQIRAYLYQPVEQSLYSARNSISQEFSWINRQLVMRTERFFDDFPPLERQDNGLSEPRDNGPRDNEPREGEPRREPIKGVPMHIQPILRNDQGEVLNPQYLGPLYFDGYLLDIPEATEAELDKMVTFTVGDSVYYSLSFVQRDEDGSTYVVQLISNIDGEQAILNNFVHLLVLCIVVFVLLSLLASYVLSKKTMSPILLSWNRQTEFVENASHELRTPLTIIQNKLEAMLTQPQATVMERAGEIGVSLGETRRLAKLTTDLMTLARADSNETQLEKERFDLDGLIRQVVEPYAELAEMQEKHLFLTLACEKELLADRSRIHELMVILLDNALKYTKEGDSIRVTTEQRDGKAVISVADSGIGIPEDSLRRVFDRFYRADKARSRQHGGSGLGLSIAKWIVDAHGGSISALPGETVGTVMQVKLKLG